MASSWLDKAFANREMARELRRTAPDRALEVARLSMLRSARDLEQEAWLFEALAFGEREGDPALADVSALVH
jgi:hypothetical protein